MESLVPDGTGDSALCVFLKIPYNLHLSRLLPNFAA